MSFTNQNFKHFPGRDDYEYNQEILSILMIKLAKKTSLETISTFQPRGSQDIKNQNFESDSFSW